MKGHMEEERIALLAGGDLPAGEMSTAAAHVAQCRACSAVLESYRRRRQEMEAFRDAGISPGDFTRLRQAVLERALAKRRSRYRFFVRPQITILRYSALAALLLAAAVIGAHLWKTSHAPQPEDRAAVTRIRPQETAPPPADAPIMEPTTKPAAAQGTAYTFERRERGRQPSSIAAALPAADAATDLQTRSHQAIMPDDVAIKLETSDPNVIIIWLASPKGAER